MYSYLRDVFIHLKSLQTVFVLMPRPLNEFFRVSFNLVKFANFCNFLVAYKLRILDLCSGMYVGVIRASRRLHQRAIVSGRGSIVNLAMRVSQCSSRWSVVNVRRHVNVIQGHHKSRQRSRWSVVSCQSRSSTSTTSSGVLSSVNNLLMVSRLDSVRESGCPQQTRPA